MLINWEILPEIEVQALGFKNEPGVPYVFVNGKEKKERKKKAVRRIAEFL